MKKLVISLCIALIGSALVTTNSVTTRAFVAVAAAAQAGQTFTHPEAGVQFQLPAGWKAKPDGEVITVSSADDALQVVFWVPDESNFDAAVKELDKELSKTIKDMKTDGKPSQDTHNGMPHYGEIGTGEVNGATIVWSVDVFGAKKPLILLTFAAPTLFEKNRAGFEKLFSSLKKV